MEGRWWPAAASGALVARARSRLAGRPVRPLHPDGRSLTAELTVWARPDRPSSHRPSDRASHRPSDRASHRPGDRASHRPGDRASDRPSSDRAWGAALLDRPGRYPALVRVSKGAGTPPGWPDVLGLAIRVDLDAGPFDLLLSTSGRPPGMRHLPLPRRTFTATYGSLLSYRTGLGRVYLAALPEPRVTALGRTLDAVVAAAGRPGGRVVLAAASWAGRWRPFGALVLREPLPAAADTGLAFDPSRRHPADLRPVGAIQHLRGVVYRGAQRARGIDPGGSPPPQ